MRTGSSTSRVRRYDGVFYADDSRGGIDFDSNAAKVRLALGTPYEETAIKLWESYLVLVEKGGPEASSKRRAIGEALDQLNTARRRAEMGGTVFDILTSDSEPAATALRRDPKAGFAKIQRLTVNKLLCRLFGRYQTINSIRNITPFKAEHPNAIDLLQQIKRRSGVKAWNEQVLPSLAFRLALWDESGDCFDSKRLKANAFTSAHELLEELASKTNLDVYFSENKLMSTEALWESRMKILLPALKLAQKGARIQWQEGKMTEKALIKVVNQLNDALEGLSIMVRRGGPHLNFHLGIYKELTDKVARKGLYKNDLDHAEKIMSDYDKYTASPNSFLISVDAGPIFSAGEILISKVANDPLVYTVEFLYVKKEYRLRYQLGTLLQNIALSLIPNEVKIIASVYANNPNRSRHPKRGWVEVGQSDNGKTIYLEYRGGQKSSQNMRMSSVDF